MRLYSGSSQQFLLDTVKNQIAEKLKLSFFDYFHYFPSDNEIRSWQNSLRAISQVFQYANLNDHGILLEYQLPQSSKRLDCLISGRDSFGNDKAVIIELKQWDRCEEAFGENEVLTWVAGAKREVLHPSVQVGQYQQYLADTQTVFHEEENPIQLSACTYLHNYNYYAKDVIFSDKYKEALQEYPLFTADDVDSLAEHLTEQLQQGGGIDVMQRIEQSRYKPSKKLMEQIGGVIKGKAEYVLLDEQLIAYDQVFAAAKSGFHDKQKTVVIINGGPGTGKSVIALNLMANLLLEGYNAHYATGSRAFTETLRKVVGRGAPAQMKYFNSYSSAEVNEVDVLICDEAHRIRATSASMYTPAAQRTNVPQVDEILKASKVCVFLIDDNQIVRPNEVGSVQYIRNAAKKSNCQIFEYQLEAQFRCAGSDAFVNWVSNTLAIKRTANVIWEGTEGFEFKIFDSPIEMEQALEHKSAQGYSARMMAGFCWKWSDPDLQGRLRDDIQIGEYQRPWNAKPDAKRLAPGIPKCNLWAHDTGGMRQVGCVYTAQGFEFDYAGIIFGRDLVYDPVRAEWIGHKEFSADGSVKRSGENFTSLVKNTYRVLLTRAMKGCYIYFVDEDTRNFFKSRIDSIVSQEDVYSSIAHE